MNLVLPYLAMIHIDLADILFAYLDILKAFSTEMDPVLGCVCCVTKPHHIMWVWLIPS
jgi:hypothetical protein